MRLVWKRDSIWFCAVTAAVMTAAVAGALFYPPAALAWGPEWDDPGQGGASAAANGPEGRGDPSGNPNGLADPIIQARDTLAHSTRGLTVTEEVDGSLTVTDATGG